MNRLSILAAMALAATPACGQAQDTGYEFTTKVIQLPAGARPHDASPGRPGESGTPRSARARSASSTSMHGPIARCRSARARRRTGWC